MVRATPPPIAILGAGPSGLALGRMLQNTNIDYTIFERDESPSSSGQHGGTLDLHVGSGQLALERAGLMDKFKSLARYDASNVLAGMDGSIVASLGAEGPDSERPEIDRKDLRSLLLGSLPSHKVRWGKRTQHVQKDSDGSMAVHFSDGSVESGFRLVVGADGAWSKARSLVTSAKPQFSGLYYLSTSVRPGEKSHEVAASLAGPGNYIAFGDSKQVGAMKLGDGSYYILVGMALPEAWATDNAALLQDPAAIRQTLLRDHLANWPQLHTDLIRYGERPFRAWPLYAMPPESLSWRSVPGVTLVGDAAHVTTPFVGEGVNCAMYDSVQLAERIAEHGVDGLDRAVEEYEKMMLPRGIDLITRSGESGKLMFAPDAPKGLLEAFATGDA